MKTFLKKLVRAGSGNRNSFRSQKANLRVESLEDRQLMSASPLGAAIDAWQVKQDLAKITVTTQNSAYIQYAQAFAQKTINDELVGRYTDAWNDAQMVAAVLILQNRNSPSTSLLSQNTLSADAIKLVKDAYDVYYTNPLQGGSSSWYGMSYTGYIQGLQYNPPADSNPYAWATKPL